MITLALNHEIDGTVTNALNKEAIHLAGCGTAQPSSLRNAVEYAARLAKHNSVLPA